MVTIWLLSAVLLGAPQQVALYGADETTARELQTALNSEQWRVVPVETSPEEDRPGIDRGPLEEAIRAFDSLMFEEAVPLLAAFREYAAGVVLEPADMADFLLASLYLARTWEVLGKHEKADGLLDELAGLQPDLSKLLEQFPPGFRARVGERASQLPSRRGALRIESRPPRADVWINGRLRGRTPLVVPDLPGGKHTVTVSLSGHMDFTREVGVTAGFGIGADATPELLEATLAPDSSGATEDVMSLLADQRLPDDDSSRVIRDWHRTMGYAVGVYVVTDDQRTTLGLLKQRGVWRGPEPFSPEALSTPPVRARLIRTVVGWLEADDEPMRSQMALDEREPATEGGRGASRAWLWTGAGAVVVGGITAAAIAASGTEESKKGSVEISW